MPESRERSGMKGNESRQDASSPDVISWDGGEGQARRNAVVEER